nr:uncharacterized protein LOC101946261 isoform X4 [Chrysemys picta bellii]
MKMCKTILPCILLLSDLVVMMAAEETIVPDVTVNTVAPVTVVTVPNTMGETVAPVTVVTVPDTPGKTVAPVTEATVLGMTMTIVLGHKKISTSGLPSVKSFSSSTMKISRESTFFFKSTAKQLTLEDKKLVRSTSTNLTFGPDKEQQTSELEIGLSIFFGILLIIVIIVCCCRWKKSRKSSFDLNSIEATIPLNTIETKEPSSDGEKK